MVQDTWRDSGAVAYEEEEKAEAQAAKGPGKPGLPSIFASRRREMEADKKKAWEKGLGKPMRALLNPRTPPRLYLRSVARVSKLYNEWYIAARNREDGSDEKLLRSWNKGGKYEGQASIGGIAAIIDNRESEMKSWLATDGVRGPLLGIGGVMGALIGAVIAFFASQYSSRPWTIAGYTVVIMSVLAFARMLHWVYRRNVYAKASGALKDLSAKASYSSR
jgi:hypothetical protein